MTVLVIHAQLDSSNVEIYLKRFTGLEQVKYAAIWRIAVIDNFTKASFVFTLLPYLWIGHGAMVLPLSTVLQ